MEGRTLTQPSCLMTSLTLAGQPNCGLRQLLTYLSNIAKE
jgi:hypothetical protein